VKRLEPDWDSGVVIARRANTEDVPRLLREGDSKLMKKISNFSTKHEIPEKEIIEEIFRSGVVRAVFAKEPTRQNIYEGVVEQFLREHLINHGVAIRKLPADGKGALYIDRNGKIRGKLEGNDRGIGKSLDFEAKLGDQIVYISHKFTRESGGMQDSQFDEQLGKLRRFRNSNKPKEHFAVACDGAYYTDKRMSEFKALARNEAPFSTAGTCGEVLEFIRKVFNIGQAANPEDAP